MATIVVVFKILFLVLITHSFVAQLGPSRWQPSYWRCATASALVAAFSTTAAAVKKEATAGETWQRNSLISVSKPEAREASPGESASQTSETRNEKWLSPEKDGRVRRDSVAASSAAADDNSAVEIRWPERPAGLRSAQVELPSTATAFAEASKSATVTSSGGPLDEAIAGGSTSTGATATVSAGPASVEEAAATGAATGVSSGEVPLSESAPQQQQMDRRIGELWRSIMNSHDESLLGITAAGAKQRTALDTTTATSNRNGGQSASALPAEEREGSGADSWAPRETAADSQQAAGMSTATATRPAQWQPPVNYAELCYLADGGSSLTLTVNEATQVGSIIGTVEVNGDPSLEGGNVDLFDVPETPAGPAQSSASGAFGSGASRQQESGNLALGGGSQSPETVATPVPNGSRGIRRVPGKRSTQPAEPTESSEEIDSVVQVKPTAARGQAPPLSASQMLGLASEQHHQQQQHSPSFYSLLQTPPQTTTSPAQTPAQQQQQQQQAVRLEPGTRNLILVRQLDKESVEGEQSLVINIRCSPRNSTVAQHHQWQQQQRAPTAAASSSGRSSASGSPSDAATVIPVRIIVTDANDHAPEFVGQQPYVVNISETATIGSVVSRDILAIDRDSAGPFSTIHYKVLEELSGPQASLLQFANPLEPTLVVAGQLDYETMSSFTLTIAAQDQAEPEPLTTTAQVQVNIIDFDDQNPHFMDDKYTLVMDETQQSLVGQNLQVLPRNLYAEDGDRGIRAQIVYSFDQLGGFSSQQQQDETLATTNSAVSSANFAADEQNLNVEHYLHLNPTSGEIRLIRQWPSKWAGAPMTLVVRATQADNRDRYTLTTLTITKPPPNSLVSGTREHTTRLASSTQRTGTDGGESSTSVATITSSHSGKQHGIEFVPDRISVNVLESAPINEKIARVRARHLGTLTMTTTTTTLANSKLDSDPDSLGSVDLVADLTFGSSPRTMSSNNSSSSKIRKTRVGELQAPAAGGSGGARRPINYQLLDDQTDQFGINGLGEIFLKQPLDFEQRQEFKFRVLATYTKYSDICQLQVNVLNVNDNKPKFTQPQYTFHLTETRLKTNLIGSVQAHDADLNDTIQYSLAGEHAHLFDVSPTGQLSLRSSIKQLNVSSCQLVVQASDTLSAPYHSQQARVNLYVAPQLVGRSINFEQQQQPTGEQERTSSQAASSKQFNSRSLLEGQQHWAQTFAGGHQQRPLLTTTTKDTTSNQRSSVATVMSSLQHMVRSVNFLDMPMSSALLLSALLAFLVCLLLIVVISMSVHFYRRRAKARQNRRRHLAAAAHLRQAHLAALHSSPDSGAADSPSAVARADRARYLQRALQRQQHSSGSSSSLGSNSNSSPTNSTVADCSPTNYSPRQQHHLRLGSVVNMTATNINSANQQQHGLQTRGRLASSSESSSAPTGARTKLTAKVAPAITGAGNSTIGRPSSAVLNSQQQVTEGARQSHQPQQTQQLQHPALNQPLSIRSPLDTLSARLQSVASGSPDLRLASKATMSSSIVSGVNHQHHHNQQQQQQQGAGSLISSLSSQSKRSYRSNSTDDSSVINCGHYSVNPATSQSAGGQQKQQEQQQQQRSSLGNSRQDSIEAAIKSLVREEEQERQEMEAAGLESSPTPRQQVQAAATTTTTAAATSVGFGQQVRPKSSPADELAGMLTAGRPGIKSYRKLPMMGSLVRPLPKQQLQRRAAVDNEDEVATAANHQADSAIASDASSASCDRPSGLMAMIRDSERRQGQTIAPESLVAVTTSQQQAVDTLQQQQAATAIRWPEGVIPHRVKKLTWDDEISISAATVGASDGADCYLAPELRIGCSPIRVGSPRGLTGAHHYQKQEQEQEFELRERDERQQSNGEHYSTEQHFLFSNPCSPALLANSTGDYICPFVAQQQQQLGLQNGGLMMLGHEGAKQAMLAPAAGAKLSYNQQQFDEQLSSLGQNNCFDYTIVQQSQFHVDAFAAGDHNHNQHLLQQQQLNQRPASYLYSNSFIGSHGQQQAIAVHAQQQQQQSALNSPMTNQDLKLHRQMSTAVL